MRVSVANSDRSFSAEPGRPILESALQAGMRVPYSCRGGNCGACRARLLSGEIVYPAGDPLGLSRAEVAEGYILLCRAHALGDLRLETVEVATPESAVVKRLPVRIERLTPLSHDVMGIELRLPAVERFDFKAGQYLDVLLPGGRRRSFSIASAPAARPLELQVRRVADGEFSERVFTTLREGDLLNIEGPLGRFVYTPGDTPVLMIGGGTGLAPLLSMLRYAAMVGTGRSLTLYWGVRSARDWYARSALEALTAQLPQLRIVPVLSDADTAWRGARGWVHRVAFDAERDWPRRQVYAAGPPEMIRAIESEYAQHDRSTAGLAVDAFDYAADGAARQRSSAATNS